MKRISEKIVHEGKWLCVQESTYQTKHGKTIIWEHIKRKRSTTGVVVVAKLKPSNRIILIKQFRPAAEGYVLGFPAGLAFGDPNHALVELKEETGYVGKIISVSPVLKTGSTITNESGLIVCIEVNERLKANKNPKQQLETGEDITVHLVKKSQMLKFIQAQQKEGVHIASTLWYLFGIKNWI